MMFLIRIFFLVLLLLIPAPLLRQDAVDTNAVTVQRSVLHESTTECAGRFIAHDLDHISTVPGRERVRMFEANGGGVGINDLDNDGDLDIVLANHAEPNTILWNEGGLNFRTERMMQGDSRAVSIIDGDGDGWLDIVFSQTNRAPSYWHNEGDGRFAREFLGGVGKPLYSINWADMDMDGDLDLVGATYDAGLLTDFGQDFIMSGNAGVYVYENNQGQYRVNPLGLNAQALGLILVDLNGDEQLDIWVGNDFALPDQAWYWTEDGYKPFDLTVMSYSTMSLDYDDVNNDGHIEVFSTDMKPFTNATKGENALRIIIDGINSEQPTDDPQITANVLQTIGEFTDWGDEAGVDTTGWSWSGKFGDLDQDGWLDLYVVNGFIEISTFAGLPNHELVQENQVFRNTGDGHFSTMPEWELGSIRSGRGMSMADLDGDGDLDIVVNNLRDAAQLFENQLCEGNSLQVDLRWPGSGNTRAIGTLLTLHSDAGTYYRHVKATSGYISGDASRVHFGLPTNAQIEGLEIKWPDGTTSTIDALSPDSLITVTRTQ